MRAALHPLARFLVALFFLLAAVGRILHFGANALVLAQMGLPFPQIFVGFMIACELVGGVGLLVGYRTRAASLLLLLATLLVTVLVNGALLSNPDEVQVQIGQIVKNLALIGGLLKFYLDGSGSYALDSPT